MRDLRDVIMNSLHHQEGKRYTEPCGPDTAINYAPIRFLFLFYILL